MDPFIDNSKTVSEILSNECLLIDCDKAIRRALGFVITKAILMFIWLGSVIVFMAVIRTNIFNLPFTFEENPTLLKLGALAIGVNNIITIVNLIYNAGAATRFGNIFKNLHRQQPLLEQDENRINRFQQMLASSRKMKN